MAGDYVEIVARLSTFSLDCQAMPEILGLDFWLKQLRCKSLLGEARFH
ncbi:hypothetical protein HMPREF9104_00295 [Lentilactobacillus kisonensis F0435]|uniref:Uncharacterized protein n=1 Tax=Lentilactobacillus kisonensis F0435 TaxID=797516 RepID=H1LCI2_9LACO|nr:hypothetical protein HMPREF9104_00295 [Lentilactobacillus kisonensis F0435]